jgi:hypothetical protein
MKRTTTEAELRQWVAEGKSALKISEILGCQKSIIANAKMVLGITGGARRELRQLTPGELERIREIFLSGGGVQNASKELGMNAGSLHKLVAYSGLPTSKTEFWKREAQK